MASERSAAAIRDAFLSGRRSAVQITADCLARAMAAQRFNVFSRVLETEALAAARAGPPAGRWPAMPALAGVPFVAKNLFDLRGHPRWPARRHGRRTRPPRGTRPCCGPCWTPARCPSA